MPTEAQSTPPKKRPFYKKKRFIIPAAIVLLFVLYKIFHHAKSAYQLVPVTQGTITETVSVTGNTTPVQSVSLAFQNSGTIAAVYHDIGEHVTAGTVIAALNSSDLYAQVQQAQANVDAAQAKLQGLQAGAQPQDIAVSQAAVATAQQNLSNMYASIGDTSSTANASANDAVRTQLATFFTNGDAGAAQFTYISSDSEDINLAQIARNTVAKDLNAWQAELATVSSSSSNANLLKVANDGVIYLKDVQNLLSLVSATLNGTTNLSSAQLASDKTAVTVATNETNTAVTSLNTILQNIASQFLPESMSRPA